MNDGERPAMDDTLTLVSSANDQRDRTQEWLDGNLYSSSGVNETLNDNHSEDQDFATRLYSLCLRLLLFLCQREQNVPSKRSKVANLKEELGKLYLWGEAFRSGKLDRALEYSNDVRGNVLDSLGDIGKILLRELWPSHISELPGGSLQENVHELKFLVEQTKDITSTKDHVATLDDSDWADESDTDEEDSSDDDTTNIVDHLRLQTQWLTQLGPILEQNLISAQKPRIQASLPATVPFSVSGPAEVYVSLVREKYKLAQDKLVERLGEANWQRHISVRKSMEASANVVEETTAPVESSAVAQSVFRPYSTFHDSALGPSIPEQTEYAPSHTSFQSSNTEGERESIRVPATPVEVTDGKPFRCFLCKCILSNIKNRVDWKMHFFADLKPYICTFADCEDELAQFPNRAAWAEHEFSQHRITQSWSCPKCPQAFNNVPRWQNHIQERHCLFFSDRNLNIAKDMACKTEATRIEDDECPLCRIVLGKPRRAFVKHVGRHMEEIALMALPRNVEEDSEEGSVSTDRTDTSFGKTGTSFQANPSVKPERVVSEANTGSSGSPTPFACEHCGQTFSESSELIVHNIAHTHPFRCVVPGCKFPGGRYQKDLDRHMGEIHGTIIDLDFESFLAEAPTETLPAVKPHAPDQSDHEEVEHVTREYDSSGEAKISPVGELLGGRVFRIRTFVIPRRSEKHLMLGIECARVLGYRDSYLFFSKNRPLLKILATQQDKDDLIDQEILPYSYRSRQIALVTAKSIFRQFGARVIEGGRRVRDDYWEAMAVKSGFTEEDMPGQIPMKSAKAAGVAGQAELSQDGAAQQSANFPKHSFTVTGGAATAPKASIPNPGNLTTRVAEGESLMRSASSRAGPLHDQALQMVTPFSKQQPSPSNEGRDSKGREATPLPTCGDYPSSSTTNSLAQRSSSLETSTPRQYGNSRQHKNDVDMVNVGRVDALGPPSQDYPMPAPPLWLSQALGRLQQTYPDDLLEATMRYTAVSTISDLPQRLALNEPVPPDTKFMYYPRIKCLDCPGKMYLPGPGGTVDSFETHLKNRLHRENVERRRKLVLPNAQEPTPFPQIVIPRPSKPRQECLNECFVSGEGIHREVLQREIRNYLGSEAHSRPSTYNGYSGYVITAVRPFSSKILDDLIEHSKLYAAENREIRKRGQDMAYGESETGRRQELRAGAEDNATRFSYWSVPEQNDFYNLVRYFGTDWQAIAATMKTKTAIMVRNFYTRRIQEGDSGRQLEECAKRATAMITNGVDMGPLPVPTTIMERHHAPNGPESFSGPVR